MPDVVVSDLAASGLSGSDLSGSDLSGSDLSGRVALVTGASRGIGRAVAERLSAEGLRVALTARSESDLDAVAEGLPGESLVIPADLTADGAAELVFGTVESAWGPVSVLVANAGGGISAPVHRTTDAEWARMLDLNLTAPFRCIRRAVPAMRDAGWGRIVAIASVAAKRGEPYVAAYTASKHGLLGLVRSAAAELARSGVTVNAVCPGYVDSAMTDGTVEALVARTGRTAEDIRAVLAAKQPNGRLVRPDEVAAAVWFCVSTPAVTAAALDVDGGALQS